MSDDGLTKSAMLLMTIGEDEAAKVLQQLGSREVQKLGAAMAGLKSVSRERIESVVNDFYNDAQKGMPISIDDEYIRSTLIKALGDDRAASLIANILQTKESAEEIENLKWMDASTVADLIRNEHPQIIATILVHLEPDQSGEILKGFSVRLRNDVILRIATLDGVQPTALNELNEAIGRILSGPSSKKKARMGGVHTAAEILNFIGTANETAIMDSVREYDPDLAQKILDEMFVFENLLDIDDRGIQILLREIQSESLILALKGAAEALREKVFKNMSQRAAEMLREDLEAKGPVRLSEVEREQKEMLKIARRLADEGQIQLGASGDDAYV